MASSSESGSSHAPSVMTRRVLTGSLDDVDIFSISQFLIIQRKSGVLTIFQGDSRSYLWFQNGQIVNGRAPGAPDGMESVQKIFTAREGTFEFAPSTDKVPVVITTDAQSLLMDLAIAADHTAREAQETASPVTRAAESDTSAIRPAVARVVRSAATPQPVLARKVGSLPMVARPSQPAFARKTLSEEEFIRQVEERLVIQESELPQGPYDVFRVRSRPGQAAGKWPAALVAGIAAAVLLMALLLAWLAGSTRSKGSAPGPVTRTAAPSPASERKYLTAPNTRERLLEDAVIEVIRRCALASIGYDSRDVRQVNVRLVREAFWDKNELAMAIAQDSVAVVQRIFDTHPAVEFVYIVAQSRLSRNPPQPVLDDAFKMKATRSIYLTLKASYHQTDSIKIIEAFGGQFDAKMVEP